MPQASYADSPRRRAIALDALRRYLIRTDPKTGARSFPWAVGAQQDVPRGRPGMEIGHGLIIEVIDTGAAGRFCAVHGFAWCGLALKYAKANEGVAA